MTTPHPLICHAIDTAMVAELLYHRLLGHGCRKQLTTAFAPLGGDVCRWVAFLAALHDLGKLSPAFQARRADLFADNDLLPGPARELIEQLSARRGNTRTETPHGVLSAHHLRRVLRSWGATVELSNLLAQVLGGHHGRFFAGLTITNAAARGDNGGAQWETWVDEFVRQLADLLGLPDPQTRSWQEVNLDTGAAVALAGLTTVSDWIASATVDKDTHAGVGVDLPSYLPHARQRAAEHVDDKLKWTVWTPPVDTTFQRLFERPARPLQQHIAELIATRTRPGILVIEAPTGEGKTYAALQTAVMLIRQLGLAGLYLAMPTQATANQAYAETSEVLARLDAGVPLMLLHGTAAEHLASDKATMVQPLVAAEVDTDAPEGRQDAEVRKWFTRLRELLSPWAVGTIDRLLKAGIRSGWAPVPLVGVSNRVVILDEVHGYDVHMSTILDRLLMWLGRLEVPVVLLSATLPQVRRDELVRAWCAGAQRTEPADVSITFPPHTYPYALWADGTGAPEVVDGAGVSKPNRDRRIALRRMPDEELVGWALEQASYGYGVAIIHNLVRRVDRTHAKLATAIASLPEHERPAVSKLTRLLSRQRRDGVEAELRALFGREGRRAPASGYIVVSTQILEQSLDLDFDVMATDPAPVDSLIQRAGRLHRFRPTNRDSPPELVLVGVTMRNREPAWPPYTVNIYEDEVLLRTWVLLDDRKELRLPDDAPALVNQVYGEPAAITCPDGGEQRWAQASRKRQRARDRDGHRARRLYLPVPTQEDAVRNLTKHPEPRSMTRKPDARGGRHG